MNLINFGISETIGFRDKMEDAHEAGFHLQGTLFAAGVYDGHLEAAAARIASRVITSNYLDLREEEALKQEGERNSNLQLLRMSYLAADRLIIDDSGIKMGGTTAATFYVEDDYFIAANTGDSRIVIGNESGAQILTVDHKPALPEEKSRVEATGGKILTLDIPRVNGELAMTRALGDSHLKPFVTAEPWIIDGFLGRENDFAVIACDGVWDTVEPAEAVNLARTGSDPDNSALLIQHRAIEKGSTDNITVIVLDLRQVTKDIKREKMQVKSRLDAALGLGL